MTELLFTTVSIYLLLYGLAGAAVPFNERGITKPIEFSSRRPCTFRVPETLGMCSSRPGELR